MTIDNKTNQPRTGLAFTAEHEAETNGEATPEQKAEAMARAEQLVDQLAFQLGRFTSLLGKKLLWVGERLREEAEDIWKEAQSIQRGEKP
jgi:hypothetical protein